MSGEIERTRNVAEAARGEQVAHARGLVAAVLEQEPSARQQVDGRGVDDRADRVESVDAGCKRVRGFVAQVALGKMRVALLDVRRVGRDQVEARVAERSAPVAFGERDVRDAEPRRVRTRDRERVGRDVGREHARQRPLARKRERDRARSCSEVGDGKRLSARQAREREFDEPFRFRTRDQDRGRDHEVEGPERAMPEQVGDRDPALAFGDRALERRTLLRRRQVLGPGVQPCARTRKRVREQALGLGARLLARKTRAAVGEQGADVVQGVTSGGSTAGTSTRGLPTLRQ